MNMKDFLLEDNVFVGVGAASKHQLLRQLSDIVSEKTSVSAQAVSKAILDREGLGSTGIGGGIALPHVAIAGLDMIACLAKPIEFEAVDDVPVDIVVLILAPAASKSDALNVLSCVARRFREDNIVKGLRAARSADEAYALLVG